MSRARLTASALGATLGLLSLGGDCTTTTPDEVAIYTLSAAPPGRVARVLEADRSVPREAGISITRGVAVAVRCWSTCDYVCVEPTLVSADSTTLMARPLLRQGFTGEFTLVAVKPGKTSVTLTSECGTKTYPVEVVE